MVDEPIDFCSQLNVAFDVDTWLLTFKDGCGHVDGCVVGEGEFEVNLLIGDTFLETCRCRRELNELVLPLQLDAATLLALEPILSLWLLTNDMVQKQHQPID